MLPLGTSLPWLGQRAAVATRQKQMNPESPAAGHTEAAKAAEASVPVLSPELAVVTVLINSTACAASSSPARNRCKNASRCQARVAALRTAAQPLGDLELLKYYSPP